MAFHNPYHSTAPMADSEARRKRAIYRAHHRGTKEMDLILGGFADAELSRLSDDELAAFELLLALPDPEIDRVVMKGGEAPADLAALFASIRRYHGLQG